MTEIIRYPDNSSYAKITNNFDLNFTFRINSYEDLWHLNQIIDVYDSRNLWPTVTIPWLIDGQADRRFNDNESSGLKLVCDFLNNMPANFEIFHPHNPEVIEALLNNVKIIDNSQFIAEVLLQLYPNAITAEKNCILMAADAGGFKPLMKLCDKLYWKGETISASKSRSYNSVTGKTDLVQLLSVKDLGGKDVLIVDDLCIYGGTFKGLSKLLKSRNCGKLYLAVSHLTVQNLGEDPVTNYFDKIFTTNSKYNNYYAEQYAPENLEIIKLF